eukprot:COSAG03_NODE_3558_length_1949_cov_2.637838_3_plen_131_part_00
MQKARAWLSNLVSRALRYRRGTRVGRPRARTRMPRRRVCRDGAACGVTLPLLTILHSVHHLHYCKVRWIKVRELTYSSLFGVAIAAYSRVPLPVLQLSSTGTQVALSTSTGTRYSTGTQVLYSEYYDVRV